MQETKPHPTITEKDGLIEIEIPVIDFKDTEIVESLPDKIILHPTYIEYKWKVTHKETEDGLPQEPKTFTGNRAILKKHIIGIEAYFSQANQRYQIAILTPYGESTSPLFESFKQAQEVKNTILNWLLK